MEGPIPTEIGNMTSLNCLNLSSNDLEGTNPLLRLLQWEVLVGKTMCPLWTAGRLPTELGQLTKLEYIMAGHNYLTGSGECDRRDVVWIFQVINCAN